MNTYTVVNGKPCLNAISVDLRRRLPALVVTHPHVSEAASRELASIVQHAILASGFDFPRLRVVVDVIPEREGAPLNPFTMAPSIALAILEATAQITSPPACGAYAEMSLNGELREARGALALVRGGAYPVFPSTVWGSTVPLLRASTLRQLATGALEQSPCTPLVEATYNLDFADVRGLPYPLVITLARAAMTRTPLLLVGAPCTNKAMIASRLSSVREPLNPDDLVDVAVTRDLAGLQPCSQVGRPFRAPHYTISATGMVGEVDLATHGTLFLDEITEFPRYMIEITAAELTVDGEHFTHVVAAANLCPCGMRGHSERLCTCTAEMVARYTEAAHARMRILAPHGYTVAPIPAPVDLGRAWPPSAELRKRVQPKEGRQFRSPAT